MHGASSSTRSSTSLEASKMGSLLCFRIASSHRRRLVFFYTLWYRSPPPQIGFDNNSIPLFIFLILVVSSSDISLRLSFITTVLRLFWEASGNFPFVRFLWKLGFREPSFSARITRAFRLQSGCKTFIDQNLALLSAVTPLPRNTQFVFPSSFCALLAGSFGGICYPADLCVSSWSFFIPWF